MSDFDNAMTEIDAQLRAMKTDLDTLEGSLPMLARGMSQIEKCFREYDDLKAENDRLRAILRSNGINW